MLIYCFKYTDAKGRTSNRVLAPFIVPGTMFAGTDISELEPVDQAMYAEAISKAKDKYVKEIEQINADFDVKHRYRQFKPEQMANITTEDI